MQVPQTIAAFAEACRTFDSEQIYELFEGEIDDDLRTSIMETYANDSIEPVRCALNSIGRSYSVQSLIDY